MKEKIMKEDNSNIDHLIGAYLDGRLKEDEYARLLDFVKSETVNKDYFNTYIRHWKPVENDEVNYSWVKLNSKLSRLTVLENNFKKKTFFSPVLFRIAAILIIGLFLGGIAGSLFFMGSFSDKNTLVFVAPKGEKSLITLSDSSKVWLNGGSRLEVDRNYGLTNRKVKMEGEAFFTVTKNKFLSFKVNAGEIDIKVVGTRFNVSAYNSDNFIETTVEEGIVQVSSNKENQFEMLRLTANQMAVFDKSGKTMKVLGVDVETITAWKNQMLIIDNEHYDRVFRKLSNWYGVEFIVIDHLSYDPRYTMTLKTESLTEVMELLHFITPMQFKIDKDKVYVKFKDPN